MLRFALFGLLLLFPLIAIFAQEKPTTVKEEIVQEYSGLLYEINEKKISIWTSCVVNQDPSDDLGTSINSIDYGITFTLDKDTKYYLETFEPTGQKDNKGREIFKSTRKEITFKDLKKNMAACVREDKSGKVISVTLEN